MSKHTQPNESSAASSFEQIRADHKWFEMSVHELHREFMRSRFHGFVTFTKDPARVPQGMGVWKWAAIGTHSRPYVSMTVLDQPTPRHYGMRSREAVLAHMLVHVEAGTQCLSAEPDEWDDAEREIEFEAMHRMNWAPFCCDKWDDTLQDFVPYDRKGVSDA